MLLSLVACAQNKNTTKRKSNSTTKKSTSVVKVKPDIRNKDSDTSLLRNKADSLIAFSKIFLGIKYKYGGQDISGFDCAGFVCYVYSHFDVKLPRTADAQALLGKEETRLSLRAGDLVYFKGRDIRNNSIGHVGIVIDNNLGAIQFISATVTAGIHIDDIDGPYWKERFVKGKRILLAK